MAKTSKTQVTTQPESGALPIRISREAMRDATVEVYVQVARTIGWMKDWEAAWSFLGKETADGLNLFNPDNSAKELGVTYDDISSTPFAESLEILYDYAYLGFADESAEFMGHESIYTWTSAILEDVAKSSAAQEWDSYGSTIIECARACREVAELANARRILEGKEDFFYFHGDGEYESTEEGSLTVRQLSLLSGMEEHSIRAAANPKRANRLETYSDQGRTRIKCDVAKAWLISKGRYVGITFQFSTGDLDLSKTKFSSVERLQKALNSRCIFIALRDSNMGSTTSRLDELGDLQKKDESGWYLDLSKEQLVNPEIIRRLSFALELDEKLLLLRSREAVATEELAQVQAELRQFKN